MRPIDPTRFTYANLEKCELAGKQSNESKSSSAIKVTSRSGDTLNLSTIGLQHLFNLCSKTTRKYYGYSTDDLNTIWLFNFHNHQARRKNKISISRNKNIFLKN